jgi:DNA-directed RNA polymerase I, II, and III subunit RPABC2
MARILGERAKQLSIGADPLIKVDEYIVDEYSIALLELKEKKIPFIIERPLPNGKSEFWKLEDLEIIS